jgi:caa(3)-type oxidase subunit IV
MTHEPAHAPLDLTDPHHDLHHGHVIIAPRTLVAVLTALLVFTILTVAASRAEVWVASTFSVVVPQWVNVGGVLFIAVVKSALVAMYFMQLKYDSILNTIIFLFCIFALGLFLFFSMIDLGQRGTVYSWKSGEIQRGGLGISTERTIGGQKAEMTGGTDLPGRKIGIDTSGRPITVWAKDQRLEAIAASGRFEDPAAQYRLEHELFAKHGHVEHAAPVSTANRSIPRTGTTPDLYKPAAAEGSGGGHGGH